MVSRLLTSRNLNLGWNKSGQPSKMPKLTEVFPKLEKRFLLIVGCKYKFLAVRGNPELERMMTKIKDLGSLRQECREITLRMDTSQRSLQSFKVYLLFRIITFRVTVKKILIVIIDFIWRKVNLLDSKSQQINSEFTEAGEEVVSLIINLQMSEVMAKLITNHIFWIYRWSKYFILYPFQGEHQPTNHSQ